MSDLEVKSQSLKKIMLKFLGKVLEAKHESHCRCNRSYFIIVKIIDIKVIFKIRIFVIHIYF